MAAESRRSLWPLAVAVFAAVTGALWWVGAPSPPLFGALVASALVAVRSDEPPAMPGTVRNVGMAIVGTAAGANIDATVLRTVAGEPVAVLGGVVVTLAVTMLVGQVLRFDRDVDGPTAAFASVAGGASGVSLAAREFGADDAVVMSVQYLRVVLVLVSVPLVAPLLGDGAGAEAPTDGGGHLLSQHLYTLCAVAAGLVLARLIRFSAGAILWTLLTSSLLAVSGVFPAAAVPTWVVAVGYAVVGANVGLSFTADRLRRLVRLFPLAFIQVVLGVVACAGIGVVFADMVGISRLDGYLATTPGGLPAVVAVAVDSGEEIGLILTMQFVRVFLALACAPLLGPLLRRGRRER